MGEARNIVELAEIWDGKIPLSFRFEVFECIACPNAHIVLFNENDEPFAQMTVGPIQLGVINAGCEQVFKAKGVMIDKDPDEEETKQ
jgi:hypothetical protein